MKEPVCVFKNKKQLNRYLKEWQTRLFLNNWIINVSFSDVIVNENGEVLGGLNEFQIDNQCSLIKTANATDDNTNRVEKFCQEKILVHELLHCKYNWILPPQSIEGKYFDDKEHALLEEMAKSLIMSKYRIKFDWFKN